MVIWPSTDNLVYGTVKEAINSDICLRCGQKNCPYIKDGKDYKELRKALRNNDMKAARGIYVQRFAQFSKMNNGIITAAIQKRNEERKKNEFEVLSKASEIIIDMGNKVSEHFGAEYKNISTKISEDIRNFQGKRIRSFEQAMTSLNAVLNNPNLKINKGDRDALINAWKAMNANDMANKLGNISKAFKGADIAMKAEKVREKSIEGYETGNWEPLMLEVESWVLGGMASGIALALFSLVMAGPLLSAGVSATVVGLMGIVLAATVGAMIDDETAGRLNDLIKKLFS